MVWYLEGFGSNLKQITWLWRLISSWFMDVIPCVNTVGDVDFSAVISIRKGTNNIIAINLFAKTTLIKIRSRAKEICTYLSPFLVLHNQRLSSVKVFRPIFLQRQMVLSETLSSLPKNQFQTKGKHHSNRWKKQASNNYLVPKESLIGITFSRRRLPHSTFLVECDPLLAGLKMSAITSHISYLPTIIMRYKTLLTYTVKNDLLLSIFLPCMTTLKNYLHEGWRLLFQVMAL